MQLKTVGESLTVLNSITNALKTSTNDLTQQQMTLSTIGKTNNLAVLKQAIARSTLNEKQIVAILTGAGLEKQELKTTTAELAQITSTNALSTSQEVATTSTLGLGTAFKGLGASIKTTASSILAFMTTNPVGWIMTVIAAIGGATLAVFKIHDAVTTSLEEQKEMLQEAKANYDNATSELKNLDDELKNTKDAIEDLEHTPTLSWVEQEELERLREITKELELQKQLKQDAQLDAANTLYSENKETFDKEFNSSYGSSSVSELKAQLSSGNISIGQLDLTDNITDMIAALQYLKEEKQKLSNPVEIQKYNSDINTITEAVKNKAPEYLSSISSYKLNMMEIADIRDLTDEEQLFYNSLSSMQKAIYEFYSPATWNTLEFNSIFNNESIEKNKEELIAMANAGTLSPETISSYANLNAAIENSELFLEDGQTAAEAFCNEITACANEAEQLTDTLPDSSSSFTDTLSGVQSLSEGFSQLSSIYDDISNKEDFDWSSILSSDSFKATFGNIEDATISKAVSSTAV